MDQYKILKIPISKEKSVFYYYRKYSPKTDTSNQIVTLPEDRTIYVCHFIKAIDEPTIKKFFGVAGKIKQIHIGEFRNKANNKKKRRTVYFAIVVFKNAEDCELVLKEPKYLQGKVNKIMQKSVKWSSNPFANEEELSDDESKPVDQHKSKMQEGGFTIVAAESEGAKKGKGSDGVNTV